MKKWMLVPVLAALLLCLFPSALAKEVKGVELFNEKVVIKRNENSSGANPNTKKENEYEILYMAMLENKSDADAYVYLRVKFMDAKGTVLLSSAIDHLPRRVDSGETTVIMARTYADWSTARKIHSVEDAQFSVNGVSKYRDSNPWYPIKADFKNDKVTFNFTNTSSSRLEEKSISFYAVLLDQNGGILFCKEMPLNWTIAPKVTSTFFWPLTREERTVIQNSGKKATSVECYQLH